MNRRLIIVWITVISLLLAGCWDQRLLKNYSLVLSIGYDLDEGGKIIKTVVIPKDISDFSRKNELPQNSKVITTIGNTVIDAENQLDQLIPEKFDRSKTRVLFLGTEMASNGIFSTLDSIYRDLRGPLMASVAIFEGSAKDAINVKEHYSRLVSSFYSELLKSAAIAGITKTGTVESIRSTILNEGQDIVIPYLRFKDDGITAMVDGVALFSKDKMTGTLNVKETTMLLILLDKYPGGAKINMQVNDDKEKHTENFVDFTIRKMKKKLKVYTENNQVKVKIDLDLRLEINEYPSDHLYNPEVMEVLTNKVKNNLSTLASKTIASMQEANNDSLGIGQLVKAYHHSTWKNLDWDNTYPTVPIETIFKVEIVSHGITN